MNTFLTRGIMLAVMVGSLTAMGQPMPARADVPGLQVSPLEYQDALTPGRVKNGYVDVSNPGDSPVTLQATVRGFRQTGTEGRLEFFDDPQLSAGIKVSLGTFDLGPREAVRVVFQVDPALLPAGGIYAAIFFRTLPPQQSPASSYVAESANIGTLLELTNGPDREHVGEVSAAHFSFWQFGSGLAGDLDYHNTDQSPHPLGFRPSLTVQVHPWGAKPTLTTGLVLPSTTRHFRVARPGSYFGLLPVIITDADTHKSVTRWVFACTGWYQWAIVVMALVVALLLIASGLRRFKRPSKPPSKRPLDGLSPKNR